MIVNKTKEIAMRHGISSAPQLAERLGVAPGTAYSLWRGVTERVDLSILQRICREFNVKPGDVLVLVEDEKEDQKIGAPVYAAA